MTGEIAVQILDSGPPVMVGMQVQVFEHSNRPFRHHISAKSSKPRLAELFPKEARRDARGVGFLHDGSRSHSLRNAIAGSSRSARRAGIQQAAAAVARITAQTAARVTGSVGVTP